MATALNGSGAPWIGYNSFLLGRRRLAYGVCSCQIRLVSSDSPLSRRARACPEEFELRLTQIKLAGFKSFVDPTIIATPGQLVGIVGPNGCGKSNVIDAVRWVLGESRASALRGESMQDVIFNGAGDRAPVGRASVELFFDNSAGQDRRPVGPVRRAFDQARAHARRRLDVLHQ